MLVRKPIIFARAGILLFTWGVETMLNADIRVAASDTRFWHAGSAPGFSPCGGATLRLPKEMGRANAMRYLLTGDEWTAEEAYRTGLVQYVTEPGKQLEKALELARRVATAAPLGVLNILKNSRTAELQGEKAARQDIFQDVAEDLEKRI